MNTTGKQIRVHDLDCTVDACTLKSAPASRGDRLAPAHGSTPDQALRMPRVAEQSATAPARAVNISRDRLPQVMHPIEINTRDGRCPAYVYRPSGSAGPWPAVLVYMDGLGIRPAMLEIGERLAGHGYYVLLPDLYYRSGPYAPMDPHAVFADAETRRVLTEKYFALATAANIMSDTRAFLDHLAAQPEVIAGGIATTGYCLGGFMSLSAAGTYPERIVAAASYHGGRLATDAPDSPHRLAPRIRARVYVAGAIEDASFPEDMKERLEAALTQAGVAHQIETYPARHGWVFRDTPVYDAAASERHWQTLLALLEQTLKKSAS
jgi:carboxymethylenebutenolidase